MDFDLIIIGTGSAMTIVDAIMQQKPNSRIAVIDKDEPGGICLTRGCIPSKIILYSAELIRTIENIEQFGINVELKSVDFRKIMDRMRLIISKEIAMIKQGLINNKQIVYFNDVAEFISPYTLKVGEEIISSGMIILCTGSKPSIPKIEGLDKINYYTSDTVLNMSELPRSISIIGGGYIAAEYGHFFSAMGSKVTIIGRNSQFLPDEEPEVSTLSKRELQKYMNILTNYEVIKADNLSNGEKKLIAVNKNNEEKLEIMSEEVLVATGRESNINILKAEKAGIKFDDNGWIIVNDYMETSQSNVWALGDADGKYQFKHVANYESMVVYYNAILKKKMKVDYHAIPHAVFTYPEIASVGLKEKEAIKKYGSDKVLIGIHRYQDTAKGEAMIIKDFFVKIILEKETMKILGAHIIGPNASILIHEIINLMYTPDQNAWPIIKGMHIHPALSEVVENAFRHLATPEQYHHVMEQHYGIPFM